MTEVIIAGALVVLLAIIYSLEARKRSHQEIVSFAKEQVYQLFLYAEKQDWVGTEKMKWVSEEIYNRIPIEILKRVVNEDTIYFWIQSVYDEFKQSLID